MAGMKSILLEAVVALQKVIDNNGTIEMVLDCMDHIDELPIPNIERETR
jgi:hypothetical protein